MYSIQDADIECFASMSESYLALFQTSIGETKFGDLGDAVITEPSKALGRAILGIFVVLSTIVLVNLLIAMMGSTYEKGNKFLERNITWFVAFLKCLFFA